MINIDTRLLSQIDENEFWLLCHLAKRISVKGKICWPSNKTLCKDTGWHIEKLQNVKKKLIKDGWIEVTTRPDKTNLYRINTQKISVYINVEDAEFEEFEHDGKSDIPISVFPTGGILENPTTNILTNEQLVREQALSIQIIEKLNAARTTYGIRGESRITKEREKMINARLKESSYSIEDVFRMIEHRCKVWKGSEFEKYIRIETLFRPSKFTIYMEEAEAAPDKDWTENRKEDTNDSEIKYSGIW